MSESITIDTNPLENISKNESENPRDLTKNYVSYRSFNNEQINLTKDLSNNPHEIIEKCEENIKDTE